MKTIFTQEITRIVKELCIEANYILPEDMTERLQKTRESEESALGRKILNQLDENLKIAREEMIPICQDTGMAVIFITIGQEVHIMGGSLNEAVQEGVRQGYEEGYLRKSVVKDPIFRENTGDNTPAVIYYEIAEGDQLEIMVVPKGFGSENMSRIFMLNFKGGKVAEKVIGARPKEDLEELLDAHL